MDLFSFACSVNNFKLFCFSFKALGYCLIFFVFLHFLKIFHYIANFYHLLFMVTGFTLGCVYVCIDNFVFNTGNNIGNYIKIKRVVWFCNRKNHAFLYFNLSLQLFIFYLKEENKNWSKILISKTQNNL